MFTIALILSLVSAAPKPLSTQETQLTYIKACLLFQTTGNADFIAVDAGGDETEGLATLECDDYADDVRTEASFLAWYATTSKRLRLSANPDDPRHCYDYRAFFNAMVKGEAFFNGNRFPKAFETACHAKT